MNLNSRSKTSAVISRSCLATSVFPNMAPQSLVAVAIHDWGKGKRWAKGGVKVSTFFLLLFVRVYLQNNHGNRHRTPPSPQNNQAGDTQATSTSLFGFVRCALHEPASAPELEGWGFPVGASPQISHFAPGSQPGAGCKTNLMNPMPLSRQGFVAV